MALSTVWVFEDSGGKSMQEGSVRSTTTSDLQRDTVYLILRTL
jgi:hypothetical protein